MASEEKKTMGWKQFLARYGFLIVSVIIFANVGLVYAIRIRGLAAAPCDTTFMTTAQVATDPRCLYIYSGKVYQPPGASKTSPHHGHTCGADITSIIPGSHKSAVSSYMSPYCVATIGTAVSTPTPTLTPTRLPTLTPTRTPTPSPSRVPTLIPTNTPQPTLIPSATPWPTSTPLPLPTPTFIPSATPWQILTPSPTPLSGSCVNGDLGNLNCDSLGFIDELDLSILLTKWAPLGPVPTPGANQHTADIYIDGKVDETDITKLLNNWKTQ